MKKIEIKKCKNCSESVKSLYMNDKLILQGDYYHDKIDDFIKGYLTALRELNVEFSLKEDETYDCPYGCY